MTSGRQLRKNGVFAVVLIASMSGSSFATARDKVVSVPDIIPPKIKHDHTKAYVGKGSTAKVIATVTDNRGVSSVVVYYRQQGTTDFSSIKMMQIGTDVFKADISHVQAPGLDYYIQAADIDNNIATIGSTHSPLVMRYDGLQKSLAEGSNGLLTDKIAAEKPTKKTATWVWVAIGTLVAGGVAVAVDNENGKGGGGGPRTEAPPSLTVEVQLDKLQ